MAIIYLSGSVVKKDFKEKDFFAKTGVRYRCLSYAYCGRTGPFYKAGAEEEMNWMQDSGKITIMMDSGAHSFHNLLYRGRHAKMVEGLNRIEREKVVEKEAWKFLDAYSQWVSEYKHKSWGFYVTFDWEKRCSTVWKATKRMRDAGLLPVPVYHGDDNIDYIQRYFDAGHKYIGLGITKKLGLGPRDTLRLYYDRIFSLTEKLGMKVHGFAVTGDLMFLYPWYSVDSTSWLKLGAYGKVVVWEAARQKWNEVHHSIQFTEKTGRDHFKYVKEYSYKEWKDLIESRGFDFEKMRTDMFERSIYNAWVFSHEIQPFLDQKKKRTMWQRLL